MTLPKRPLYLLEMILIERGDCRNNVSAGFSWTTREHRCILVLWSSHGSQSSRFFFPRRCHSDCCCSSSAEAVGYPTFSGGGDKQLSPGWRQRKKSLLPGDMREIMRPSEGCNDVSLVSSKTPQLHYYGHRPSLRLSSREEVGSSVASAESLVATPRQRWGKTLLLWDRRGTMQPLLKSYFFDDDKIKLFPPRITWMQ